MITVTVLSRIMTSVMFAAFVVLMRTIMSERWAGGNRHCCNSDCEKNLLHFQFLFACFQSQRLCALQ